MNRCTKFGCVLLLLLVGFLLPGCQSAETEKPADSADNAAQITELTERYYDALVARDDDAAIAAMYFADGTDEYFKELCTDFSGASLVQSYTVYDIQELTPELYAVNVVGVQLSPFELVYGDDGAVIGTKEPTDGKKWHVQSLDATHYAAYVDGSWKFCVAPQAVPEGLYDFPEEAMQTAPILPMSDGDTP